MRQVDVKVYDEMTELVSKEFDSRLSHQVRYDTYQKSTLSLGITRMINDEVQVLTSLNP